MARLKVGARGIASSLRLSKIAVLEDSEDDDERMVENREQDRWQISMISKRQMTQSLGHLVARSH